MRYSAEHKRETRQRILQEAARLFRERGLDDVSVADVMGAAGLTHGGFYAHFGSKEELIGETLRAVEGTSVARLRPVAEQAPPGQALPAMVASYLSPEHRARPARGCVVAALGQEAGRHSAAVRRGMAERARSLARTFLPYLPVRPDRSREEQALALAASLVGAMLFARLEEDPAAAERVLAASRRFVLEALGAAPQAAPAPKPPDAPPA
jgi:TetR/AcrR family transcriptional regulator, transcriptional repressor for nem operon